jgi:HEAT repeats
LARAQLVIARELGAASWVRLRREVRLAPLRAAVEGFAERGWPPRHAAGQALAAAGADGVEVALESMHHPDPKVRRGVAGFLDHHATDTCVPHLTALALYDPDPDVRRTALHTLSCERCKETPLQGDVLPLVVRAFREDPNRLVRANAGSLLRERFHEPQVREAFRAAAVEDPSGLVRRRAAYHLMGEDDRPLLAHVARHDPDPHVRVQAAVLLADTPDHKPLAQEVLEGVLAVPARRQTWREAHLALKRLSPAYRQLAAQRARDAHLARARDARSA